MTSPCSATPPPDLADPLRLDPSWQSEPVVALARGIVADNGFDRLPILADALEEAGCDNQALLHHLRFGEPHRVECWGFWLLLRATLLFPHRVPIRFAFCPAGSFLMGSDHSEAAKFTEERPTHWVSLTKSFYAGIYPITQAQYRVVMGSEPSGFRGDRLPVEQVSWDEAQTFCKKASVLTGRLIRLPTEAEWEYACRAGTQTEFHFGNVISDRLANYAANYSWNGSPTGIDPGKTTPVGMYPANPWGLHDTHGNVWEWCQDWHDEGYYKRSQMADPLGPKIGTHKVCRGGSWGRFPRNCRAAFRGGFEPAIRRCDVGFRVVFTAT